MFYEKNIEKELSLELFQNPTAEYRGTPFWAWNCMLNPQMLSEQMDCLKEMGFGGFHMHPRTGFANPYLSKEHLDLVKHCVNYAKQEKMYAYLYDEDRWPSGAAGGLVTKDPQYRARYLCFTVKPKADATILSCYDVELDKEGCLYHYCRIPQEATAVGVKWYACAESPTPDPWHNNQTYVNTLSKAAIDRFIEITYDAYLSAIGDDFGRTVPSIFTDEPQFFRKTTLNFPEEKKDTVLPWSDDLLETYQAAYGEDLLEHLPQLFWELPDGKASLIRYHYHDHITERFTEAFADNCGKWCTEHGLMLTGHMMEEPTLHSQTAALGETMRAYRGFQLPGIDMLCNRYEYTTAKQAQSAAHQYGREGVLSELYGVTGWTFDFRGHKLQGDWQAALGVTVRVPHLSWVSMAGEAKRDYPASISYQSPWYKEYSLVENHFARVNTALTRGKPVVKVGVIHPVESYWLHWGPSQQTSSVRKQLDDNFENLTQWLLMGAIDFDFISESLLPSQCEQASAPLKVGEMTYDVILVPACETLRKTTVDRLTAFRNMGGRLIFLGDAPRYLDAQESSLPQSLYKAAEVIPFSRSAVLDALEEVRLIELHNANGSATDNLIYQLRQDQNCYWLFIAQGKEAPFRDNAVEQQVYITLKGKYTITCYDTLTGKTTPVAVRQEGNLTKFKWVFHLHDSLLLRLEEGETQTVAEMEKPIFNRKLTVSKTVPITLDEPNVLMLDQAEYALDDGPYAPETEILLADNDLRERLGYPLRSNAVAQPWTIPEEPFTHTARLRFTIHSQVEIDAVQLALEDAERVEICWNGTEIPSEITGWYVDHAIKTVSLGKVNKGQNILELSIPFGKRMDLEWCYLLGDFGVQLRGEAAVLTEPVRELGFGDITSQGLPFYGGNVVYHIPVEAAGNLQLHLPHYRGALVAVSTDGERKGTIAFAPYNLTIPRPKNGVIDLTLFGNRGNTFGAIHRVVEGNNWLGPDSWRTVGDQWSESYQLFSTGILSAPVILEQKEN